jgi:hypothetical protein
MSMDTVTQITHLLAPLAGLIVMVAVHIVLCRFNPHVPLLNGLAWAGLAGILAVCAGGLSALGPGGAWVSGITASLFVDIPVYGCLAYGYANFVNLGQASVRVRIYKELLSHPDGVGIHILKETYDEESMLQARIARLVNAGDLLVVNGRYRIGRKRLLVIANVIFALKHIILGRQSEFNT